MTFGSLFSGIGGLDLGLERAGMRCIWQCEIDPFARKVLAKHWPGIPCYEDVRPIDGTIERPDLICGGFPCQDVSIAGLGAGLDGARSGLWFQFHRIIRELRPRFAIVENTPGLLIRGFDRVLGSLADIGFDAEWSCFPACAMGAPHTRERLFIVAYPDGLLGEEGLRIREWRTASPLPSRDYRTPEVLRMESAYRDRGVPDGVRARLDRRFVGVGNAVYPDAAEWIGRRILESVRTNT